MSKTKKTSTPKTTTEPATLAATGLPPAVLEAIAAHKAAKAEAARLGKALREHRDAIKAVKAAAAAERKAERAARRARSTEKAEAMWPATAQSVTGATITLPDRADASDDELRNCYYELTGRVTSAKRRSVDWMIRKYVRHGIARPVAVRFDRATLDDALNGREMPDDLAAVLLAALALFCRAE